MLKVYNEENRKPIFIEQLLCVRHCMLFIQELKKVFAQDPCSRKISHHRGQSFALSYLEGKAKANKRERDIISLSLFHL